MGVRGGGEGVRAAALVGLRLFVVVVVEAEGPEVDLRLVVVVEEVAFSVDLRGGIVRY